ncbi:hypothetical protein QEH56_23055 [Pelagicoccus enzymogenes]|uniref:hypothetical protein n=1 Tax=Pelagicoccus enzymogenes TaxID=2773457 RepID=UPI002810207D|nr:hypothetical protein [Pelagicoccus enzymogenes]MDQ8201064.1 hypothetical protein [Pelagicoccus enzymogenes]
MDAADIIHEIEILPKEEKGKVIDFVQHLAQQQFEEEQIRIAEKRLEDYDKGLEKAIPHEEAMRLLREG